MHATADATKDIVEKIQGNHLSHLQDGITTLVEANKTQVELLHSIDKGIATLNATLIERGRRRG